MLQVRSLLLQATANITGSGTSKVSDGKMAANTTVFARTPSPENTNVHKSKKKHLLNSQLFLV